MVLRLQLAVEAESVKYLIATANDALGRVRNGQLDGEVVREGRKAWFHVERLSDTEAQAQAEPEPSPEPPVTLTVEEQVGAAAVLAESATGGIQLTAETAPILEEPLAAGAAPAEELPAEAPENSPDAEEPEAEEPEPDGSEPEL